MTDNPQQVARWSYRLSVWCFALAWFLPLFPDHFGILFPGAWAFVASPFVAFGCWVTFLFDGFEPRMLWWAVLLTVTTTMNGALLFASLLREAFVERPMLLAVGAGVSAVAATILCHWPPGAESFLPAWSPVELAWIASFVLMSASGVASCFAGVPHFTTQRSGNDDRSL